jgi:hypothetical protein
MKEKLFDFLFAKFNPKYFEVLGMIGFDGKTELITITGPFDFEICINIEKIEFETIEDAKTLTEKILKRFKDNIDNKIFR